MYNLFVIIVTYNGMNWLQKCLDSVYKSTISAQVIVVDNRSTDSTVSYIKDKYPQTMIFENNQNLGFGRANNIGIKYAIEHSADYIYLLNQDAWVETNTIEHLIKISKASPEYGILSPIQYDASMCIERQFSSYLSKAKLNVENQILDVTFVNAAAWLITTSCIKTVGLFDSLFYHYGEDENYCHRAYYYKFKIGIIPNVFVIHDRGERIINRSFLKTLSQHIIFTKCNLANINYPLSYLLWKYYFKTPVFLLKKIYRRQFKIFFARIIIIIKLPFMLKSIVLARSRTKKQNEFNF